MLNRDESSRDFHPDISLLLVLSYLLHMINLTFFAQTGSKIVPPLRGVSFTSLADRFGQGNEMCPPI